MKTINPEDMTGKDVIDIARARGFDVVLRMGPPPMPVLRDPGGHIAPPTDALLEALRAYREDILKELGAP